MPASSASDQTPLLTSAEVAARLGVTRRTVRTWTVRGVLPHVRVGGVRRYRPADLEALIGASAVPLPIDEEGVDA
jgi:excisionase family DNA binding protein